MSEVVKRLRERRQNVWEQAKDLADRAAEENRAFSGDEEGSWQNLNSELDALDKRIKNVLDGEQRAKETEEAFAKLEGKPKERGKEPQAQASEFRAFARGERGRVFDVVPDGPLQLNLRQLNTGTAAEGGDTVPTSFFGQLVAHMIETSSILRAGATVLNTAGGEDLQIPKTTGHSTASIVDEGDPIGSSEPSFGQVTLGAYKYGILLQVSRELIMDDGVDLEGYLARQAGEALGNGFGQHAIVGTGSSQPWGLVTRADAGVTGADGVSAPTAENLIDLKFSVIEPYRRSQAAVWLMRDATLAEVRKLRDESGGSAGTGQFLFQPSLIAGEPDTLLGHRIVTDPFPPEVGESAESVVFGDVSRYFARLAGGVRFERSDDYAFNTDLVTFRALLRADGDLVDQTGAVKTFTGGGSAA